MQQLEVSEIREIQLSILDYVHNFCLENSLNYYLGYGTLLGAIRHKGYIPWDDDIDLIMPRKDYEKFLNIFSSDKFSIFDHSINKDYPYAFIKVSANNTRLIENIDYSFSELGINIDIFPIDTVLDNSFNQKVIRFEIRLLKAILNSKQIKIVPQRAFYKNLILFINKLLFKPINISYIVRRINYLAKKNNSLDSDYVGCLVEEYDEKLDINIFNEIVEKEFECKLYNIPIGYDKYLISVYGDYMKFPPKELQETHHDYKVYKINED